MAAEIAAVGLGAPAAPPLGQGHPAPDPAVRATFIACMGRADACGICQDIDRRAARRLRSAKRELDEAGCDEVFSEQVSSVAARAKLDEALKFIRKGDVLVVTKLDRLARSMRDLVDIVAKIEAKGATLRILAMNLDTATPTGRLMLNVLGRVAEFERAIMLERQREGISKAKADGKYKGRAPTARAKATEVRELHAAGVGPVDIANRLGIGRSSVYRVLDAAE
jgi:DNA invertase Pin-like site-specific DNA recombinase